MSKQVVGSWLDLVIFVVYCSGLYCVLMATRSYDQTKMKLTNLASVNYLEGMNTDESSQLILDCIAGDEHAIELFVRRYEATVFRVALSIVNDPIEANEVTQETFISALKSLRTYRHRSSIKAWLYTIALNTGRSHLRSQKILERLRTTLIDIFQVETQKQPLPEDIVVQNEKEIAIWESLNNLDERHRIVMILRYFHGLSVTEISEMLSVNEGTVHSRLHTARERLRVALAPTHGE